jgi:CBS-domain-containing membrane protein
MHGTPHIVSDVMTPTVAAIGRKATFKEIVRLMQDWKVSALPVLEGEGHVVGLVSEADLLPKEEFRDSDPDLPQSRLRSTGGPPSRRCAACPTSRRPARSPRKN